MKTSLVIVYSNLGLGGIPIQILDISNVMHKSHPEVGIYIFIKEKRAYDIRNAIHNPNVKIINFYDVCILDSSLIFMFWTWYRIFKINPSSILSFISPYGLTVLAAKIFFFWRKTTIVINEAHFTSTMVTTMKLPIVQQLGIRFLYPLADSIIVPTKALYDDLHTQYFIPYDRMTIIRNWSRFAHHKLPQKKRFYDVLYAGRIDAEKNILQLIRIFESIIKKSMPQLRILIIGDGSDKSACVKYIQNHKLKSNLSIRQPTVNISTIIRKAKICIFNPKIDSEGFPISLLDAMSLGTLVVTTTFKGIHEVLHNSNSVIAPSTKSLSRYIIYSLLNISKMQNKILRAKNDAMNKYSIHNARNYIDLLKL